VPAICAAINTLGTVAVTAADDAAGMRHPGAAGTPAGSWWPTSPSTRWARSRSFPSGTTRSTTASSSAPGPARFDQRFLADEPTPDGFNFNNLSSCVSLNELGQIAFESGLNDSDVSGIFLSNPNGTRR
jgi:hypothetical protein